MATGTHVIHHWRHDGPVIVDAMNHTFNSQLLCAKAGCTATWMSHQTRQDRCSGHFGKFTGELPSEPGPDRDRAFYRLWVRYDGNVSIRELGRRFKMSSSSAQRMFVRGQELEGEKRK